MKQNKSIISRALRHNAPPADQSTTYFPLTAQYKQRSEAGRPHKRKEDAPLHEKLFSKTANGPSKLHCSRNGAFLIRI